MNTISSIARLCAVAVGLFFGLSATNMTQAASARAIDHGPIGVMGDHYHRAREWMLSVRLMRMHMSGNQTGGDELSDGQVLMQPNAPGRMPPVLSVVPQDMDMDMLMFGAMYAPTDRITLMAMLMASSKDMDLQSYSPPNMMSGDSSRTSVGVFSTSNSDIESVSLNGLFRLYENASHRSHLTLGLAQSIADTDATDWVLTPMGVTMNMRLPYGMQIGDESLRLNAALTHVYTQQDWVFGGQVSGKFELASEEWHFGNSRGLTLWAQRAISDRVSLSSRVAYQRTVGLKGTDALITAPVQTAVTSNYGGSQWYFGLGANAIVPIFAGKPERLGIELELPFDGDVRGVQMSPQWRLTLGVQKSF